MKQDFASWVTHRECTSKKICHIHGTRCHYLLASCPRQVCPHPLFRILVRGPFNLCALCRRFKALESELVSPTACVTIISTAKCMQQEPCHTAVASLIFTHPETWSSCLEIPCWSTMLHLENLLLPGSYVGKFIVESLYFMGDLPQRCQIQGDLSPRASRRCRLLGSKI